MPFVTYILRCADDSLYTGWTDRLNDRLRKHNEGKGAKYTRARLPVSVEICWSFERKTSAMSAEWYLKRLSRQQKLALISGDLTLARVLPSAVVDDLMMIDDLTILDKSRIASAAIDC